MVEYLGTARGCGWQKIGAFVNLGAYCGHPFCSSSSFCLAHWRKGEYSSSFCSESCVEYFNLFKTLWIMRLWNAGPVAWNHMWSLGTSLVASDCYPMHWLGERSKHLSELICGKILSTNNKTPMSDILTLFLQMNLHLP